MPSIIENKQYWDGDYGWERGGDEWSRDWGTVPIQWYGTILPRIHRFLPAETIVEIGCGFGRWTQFLKDHCRRLVAVDLSEMCVAACRRRFETTPHVELRSNDGTSLAFVADGAADLVFSFDALPLVDRATIDAYLGQLPRILTRDGVAFLHHSNLGAYERILSPLQRFPRIGALLRGFGWPERDLHWRDPGVSAELVERLAMTHGLRCISQEIFRWGTKHLFVEAFSAFTKEGSRWNRPCARLKNIGFDREAANLRQLSPLYATEGGRDARH